MVRPLDTAAPRATARSWHWASWLLALLLALPMMLAIRWSAGATRASLLPAWGPAHPPRLPDAALRDQHRGPGVIGLLYVRLARAYWLSQRVLLHDATAPNPRVLYLILGIVLLFWACFLPLLHVAALICPVPRGPPRSPAPPHCQLPDHLPHLWQQLCEPLPSTRCSPRTTVTTANAAFHGRGTGGPGCPQLLQGHTSRPAWLGSPPCPPAASRPLRPSHCPRRSLGVSA